MCLWKNLFVHDNEHDLNDPFKRCAAEQWITLLSVRVMDIKIYKDI